MHTFELCVETIDSCGGEKRRKREIIEIQASSPAEYIMSYGRWPVRDTYRDEKGELVVVTGDRCGNMVRYTVLDSVRAC